jgi:hypothetical protein
MAVQAHIGDTGVVAVEMTDEQGNLTDTYDKITGIRYDSSNPNAVSVLDEDAEPKDAEVEFKALTTEPARITVTFDGDPGSGVRPITLVSEDIEVVAGEATGGTVTIRLVQQP